MSLVLGVTLGLGLYLLWWSAWDEPVKIRKVRQIGRLQEMINRSGLERISSAGLVASSLFLGIFCFGIILLFTRSQSISACISAFAAWTPFAVVSWRSHKRNAVLSELWPDVVDHLRSAIRAGMSLPDGLSDLANRGPAELREYFSDFAKDYRASGNFVQSIKILQDRLADPVADRIFVALRLTRDVGGADLGKLLGTLSEFLRDTARVRNELQARQSWTINAARIAVAAPWIVLLALSTNESTVKAYSSQTGWLVLGVGLAISIACYRIMIRIGALPQERRILR